MPITLGTGITAVGLDPTSITTGLGYTPVNKAGDSMTGPLLQADGTYALPSYSFSSHPGTGFSQPAANQIWGSSNGNAYWRLLNSQMSVDPTTYIGWHSVANFAGTDDLKLYRDGANILAQRNGTIAQTFRVYNTYTDASNYERLAFSWSGNILTIGTEAAGTGIVRALNITGRSAGTNAAVGAVGEIVTASASSVGISSATPANVTSISLTAGDWDVWGTIVFTPAGSTVATSRTAGINTVSATLAGAPNYYAQDSYQGPAGIGGALAAPIMTINISTTTTVYLVASSVFSVSTMAVSGGITARRR